MKPIKITFIDGHYEIMEDCRVTKLPSVLLKAAALLIQNSEHGLCEATKMICFAAPGHYLSLAASKIIAEFVRDTINTIGMPYKADAASVSTLQNMMELPQ